MTGRPEPTPQGWRGSMTIGPWSAFVCVEGKGDEYFYGELIRAAPEEFGPGGCRILRASELPSWMFDGQRVTGGKQALVTAHRRAGELDLLVVKAGDAASCMAFIADKDVDDLCGSVTGCRHFLLTAHYCFENYLFVHGDIGRAVAIAANQDPAKIELGRAYWDGWRRAAAQAWFDWIVLCLLCARVRGSAAGYGGHSVIHERGSEAKNAAKELEIRTQLKDDSRLTDDEFEAEHQRVRELVASRIADGTFDTLFNGKWYRYFIEKEVRSRSGEGGGPVWQQVVGALKAGVDARWAPEIRTALRELIAFVRSTVIPAAPKAQQQSAGEPAAPRPEENGSASSTAV